MDGADQEYQIRSFSTLPKIQAVDLTTYCHAVILDLRDGCNEAAELIHWVGEVQCPVALICLCEDYQQMQAHEDRLHLVDDVIAGSPEKGELHLRISSAIQSRRADLQRRQDQELLSALFDNAPDSIYFKDRDSRFIRVNTAKANKHQASPDAMVGKTDFDYFTQGACAAGLRGGAKDHALGRARLGRGPEADF